jgi:hypothetical protein
VRPAKRTPSLFAATMDMDDCDFEGLNIDDFDEFE